MGKTPNHHVLHFLFVAGALCGLLLSGCDPEQVRKEQFISAGRVAYEQRCANCHGTNGKGIGNLYPPLAGSDYLLADRNRAACLIRNGLKGPVVVNGREYNLAMPAQEALTDVEIAHILTYIYNDWGNEGKTVETKEVRAALQNCQQP